MTASRFRGVRPPREDRGVRSGLLLLLVGLAGCASSTPSTTSAGSTPAGDPDNPREPEARAALTLVPKAAPSTAPGPAASYTPWPGFLHDSTHTGSAPVTGPQTGKLRWKRRLEGAVVPGPAIAKDGTIYIASNAGTLHALDPATGKDRWTYAGGGPYGSDLSTVPLVLVDGTILWPGPSNTLIALTPAGELRWKLELDSAPLSPALGDDGTVYVNDMGGGVRALDLSGAQPRTLWSLSLGSGSSYGQTTLTPEGLVLGVLDNTLFGVRDGKVAWRFKIRSMLEVTPAVAPDGTVVVGTNDGNEYGVDGRTGKQVWATPRGSITYSSAAVTRSGIAYFGDHRGALDVLESNTGKVIARHVGLARTKARGDVGVWTAPAVDEQGNVYFGTRTGHVYGFSALGKRLFDIDAGDTVDSYPALGPDGTLYIGSESGTFYAVGD